MECGCGSVVCVREWSDVAEKAWYDGKTRALLALSWLARALTSTLVVCTRA